MMNNATASQIVTDPVCSMMIDSAKAAGSSSYNGTTYHFCSRGCETKFDAAPAVYTGTDTASGKSSSCCSPGHSCH